MKVVVTGDVRKEGLDIVREFADIVTIPEPVSPETLKREIRDADAVLHKMGVIDEDILASQTKLKIVARHGVGLDLLDLPALKKRNIPVSITPQANSRSVAEACIGLMLAALRKFSQGEKMLKRDHAWKRERLMGRELGKMTVGLIGYGRIGRIVASILDGFGARVLVHDVDPGMARADGREVVPLEQIYRDADIISLHCPLLPSTAGMINSQAIAQMKEGVILVNTARGQLFDSEALVAGLRSGKIGAVATDSFNTEPPDYNDALFTFENALTTPHVAAMTLDAQTAMAVSAAEEIRRVLVEGKAPTNNVCA